VLLLSRLYWPSAGAGAGVRDPPPTPSARRPNEAIVPSRGREDSSLGGNGGLGWALPPPDDEFDENGASESVRF
jgi:hypothetical protein